MSHIMCMIFVTRVDHAMTRLLLIHLLQMYLDYFNYMLHDLSLLCFSISLGSCYCLMFCNLTSLFRK